MMTVESSRDERRATHISREYCFVRIHGESTRTENEVIELGMWEEDWVWWIKLNMDRREKDIDPDRSIDRSDFLWRRSKKVDRYCYLILSCMQSAWREKQLGFILFLQHQRCSISDPPNHAQLLPVKTIQLNRSFDENIFRELILIWRRWGQMQIRDRTL